MFTENSILKNQLFNGLEMFTISKNDYIHRKFGFEIILFGNGKTIHSIHNMISMHDSINDNVINLRVITCGYIYTKIYDGNKSWFMVKCMTDHTFDETNKEKQEKDTSDFEELVKTQNMLLGKYDLTKISNTLYRNFYKLNLFI